MMSAYPSWTNCRESWQLHEDSNLPMLQMCSSLARTPSIPLNTITGVSSRRISTHKALAITRNARMMM